MRLARLVPCLLFLWSVCAIWAADPFVGKWKLNLDKSDFGTGPKAKSGSTKYDAQGDGYMYESETDFGEGNTARLGAPVKFDGTVDQGNLDGRDVTFVSKKIDGNNYEVLITDKESGKVTQRFQYGISSDNKTLTFLWMKTGQDKPFLKMVYDKE